MLGLFPFVGGTVALVRRQVTTVTALTVAGLALVVLFVHGGYLARSEGFALVGAWALATWVAVRFVPGVLTVSAAPHSRSGVLARPR